MQEYFINGSTESLASEKSEAVKTHEIPSSNKRPAITVKSMADLAKLGVRVMEAISEPSVKPASKPAKKAAAAKQTVEETEEAPKAEAKVPEIDLGKTLATAKKIWSTVQPSKEELKGLGLSVAKASLDVVIKEVTDQGGAFALKSLDKATVEQRKEVKKTAISLCLVLLKKMGEVES
jgi:hypothetical protein